MIKRLYRYYGMCGTFKSTTIKNLLEVPNLPQALPAWSMIKPWKSLENGVLGGLIQKGNNMNLAALGLCNLENVLRTTQSDLKIEVVLAERGVLDNLFYSGDKIGEERIKKIREKEIEIEDSYGFKEIRSTLLIMKDKEFIEKFVITEPTHSQWFPDVETYLSKQEEYIKFITSHIGNNSLRYRYIESVRDYFEIKFKKEYEELMEMDNEISTENVVPGNIFKYLGEVADYEGDIYVKIIETDVSIDDRRHEWTHNNGILVLDLSRPGHNYQLWGYNAFARSFEFAEEGEDVRYLIKDNKFNKYGK